LTQETLIDIVELVLLLAVYLWLHIFTVLGIRFYWVKIKSKLV